MWVCLLESLRVLNRQGCGEKEAPSCACSVGPPNSHLELYIWGAAHRTHKNTHERDPPLWYYEVPKIGNASLFTNFCSQFFAPLDPPPSQPAKWWISSWFSIRRTSNSIANTQPKLRTNPPKIANKQNYEQTGVSEKKRFQSQSQPPQMICGCNRHAFIGMAKVEDECLTTRWLVLFHALVRQLWLRGD